MPHRKDYFTLKAPMNASVWAPRILGCAVCIPSDPEKLFRPFPKEKTPVVPDADLALIHQPLATTNQAPVPNHKSKAPKAQKDKAATAPDGSSTSATKPEENAPKPEENAPKPEATAATPNETTQENSTPVPNKQPVTRKPVTVEGKWPREIASGVYVAPVPLEDVETIFKTKISGDGSVQLERLLKMAFNFVRGKENTVKAPYLERYRIPNPRDVVKDLLEDDYYRQALKEIFPVAAKLTPDASKLPALYIVTDMVVATKQSIREADTTKVGGSAGGGVTGKVDIHATGGASYTRDSSFSGKYGDSVIVALGYQRLLLLPQKVDEKPGILTRTFRHLKARSKALATPTANSAKVDDYENFWRFVFDDGKTIFRLEEVNADGDVRFLDDEIPKKSTDGNGDSESYMINSAVDVKELESFPGLKDQVADKPPENVDAADLAKWLPDSTDSGAKGSTECKVTAILLGV